MIKKDSYNLIPAFFAGMLIGVGGYANLISQNKILGALLFSFGLISILELKLPLYTGRIAYVGEDVGLVDLGAMLIANFAGAALLGLFVWWVNPFLADSITSIKSEATYSDLLFSSYLCGICVYCAVEGFKRTKSVLAIMLPVFLFVYCGFDHCIANMFYSAASSTPISFRKILVAALGNSFGALALHYGKETLWTKI
nr:MAG TPA: Formate/nitrite transporter [Caudoviricetes sp.]